MGAGSGIGMGGRPWLATVTTLGVQVVVVVVRTTLRTRFTLRTGVLRAILRAFTFFFATLYTCAGGASATCIAPPPMSAPPQVQAQSFAKAMRTDIIPDLLQPWSKNRGPTVGLRFHFLMSLRKAEELVKLKHINPVWKH